jgi:hypothetical protein
MGSREVLLNAQYPIQWIMGAISLEIMWLRHEANHLPPSIAKVKIAWSYTSISP